jgi:hypothetical protein
MVDDNKPLDVEMLQCNTGSPNGIREHNRDSRAERIRGKPLFERHRNNCVHSHNNSVMLPP